MNCPKKPFVSLFIISQWISTSRFMQSVSGKFLVTFMSSRWMHSYFCLLFSCGNATHRLDLGPLSIHRPSIKQADSTRRGGLAPRIPHCGKETIAPLLKKSEPYCRTWTLFPFPKNLKLKLSCWWPMLIVRQRFKSTGFPTANFVFKATVMTLLIA